MVKRIIAPSILASDFANLQSEIQMLNASAADWVHCDIMDGLFVPNISFGIPVLEAIHKHSNKFLDVHLMIQEPSRFIDQFKNAGADNITVHYEACLHLHRTVEQIKNVGLQTGVALNPHTAVNLLEDIIADLDVVLLMSVNPGFGGQIFIEQTYSRISKVKELVIKSGSRALIEIDGGVNLENAPLLLEAGANILVAGNFVFSSTNPTQTIAQLKELTN